MLQMYNFFCLQFTNLLLHFQLGYLSKYGYLPSSDLETGNLRADDQLKDAIRALQVMFLIGRYWHEIHVRVNNIIDLFINFFFQSYGNIPATGEVDDKTKQLLRQPRCGLPDIPQSPSRRRKRYLLQGQKWQNMNLTWRYRQIFNLTSSPLFGRVELKSNSFIISLQSKNLQLDQGSVRSVLHRALEVWSKNSRLNFKELDSNTADILVYFEKWVNLICISTYALRWSPHTR